MQDQTPEVFIEADNLPHVVDASDVMPKNTDTVLVPKTRKRISHHARMEVAGNSVRYLYFGNIHKVKKNGGHGGIICAAISVQNTSIFVGLALVPDCLADKFGKPRKHKFEKLVVRDIAWLRLNHEITGSWDNDCTESIIANSTVRFRLANPVRESGITAEALHSRNASFSIIPRHEPGDNNEELDAEIAADLKDTEIVDHVVFKHITELSHIGKLPRWVRGLKHHTSYKDEEFVEITMPENANEFAFHALRVVTADDETAGIDTKEGGHPENLTNWFTVAEVYYDNNRKPLAYEPLIDWFESIDEMRQDINDQLDAIAHAEVHGVVDCHDIGTETAVPDFAADLETLEDDEEHDADIIQLLEDAESSAHDPEDDK